MGFDKNSLERLEQLFRKTVGNEKEIRREDFKKIVMSKNVSHLFFFRSSKNGWGVIHPNYNYFLFFFLNIFSRFSPIEFSKYSTKTIRVQFLCKSSSMPFISLLANRKKIKSNFCSKSTTLMVCV